MDIQTVLEEYRKGDESKRLSLFMAYRDLREHFERIEQESAHDDSKIRLFPWGRKHTLPRAA